MMDGVLLLILANTAAVRQPVGERRPRGHADV